VTHAGATILRHWDTKVFKEEIMAEYPALPRVTYSNVAADFGPLHDWLDQEIPKFRAGLGESHPNLIAGAADREGTEYPVTSPIDRSLEIGRFVDASEATVARAVAAAHAALPGWSARPWPERVALLRRFASEVAARKYELAMAALYEVGKSRLEAVGEAEEAVDLVNYYCDEMERNQGFARPMARAVPQEETRCVLRPVGVFAIISPFNFPVALPCNLIGACLIAGNTAVFKPSPGSSLTGKLLMDCAVAAGLPAGVLNLVCGEQAGPRLAEAQGVDGFAFTGSHAVGMQLARLALTGPYSRPVIAEMGGKNPAYVAASADLEVAAEGLMRSAFGLQGEKCSACSVAYVEESVHDALLEFLVRKSRALVVGSPEDRATFVGPLIDEAVLARFDRACAAARQDGRIVLGGHRLLEGAYAAGNYVAPTIVSDLPADHWLNFEELFLPFLSVQRCRTLAEGIARGNRVQYGLTAGVYAQQPGELELFFSQAQAGALYANRRSGATTGAWPGYQTFCGWKGSGVDGKGGLGPYHLPRFMREQSHTIMHRG
jgi:1-pyrroline-5-carboxylate dehydrogenase